MIWFFPIVPAVDPGPDGSGGSLIGIILLVSLIINAVPCILAALALWQTARWRGIVRPWLALIPIADLWVLGSLCDRYRRRKRGEDGWKRKVLPILGMAALAAMLLPDAAAALGYGLMASFLVAFAIWGAFLLLRCIALCEFYEGYAPKDPGLYIGLSIAVPILIPILIFKCRW